MGQEIACNLQIRRKSFAGKALLETDFLLFRGEERLKILFRDLRSVKAEAGLLKLDFDGGPASLELGAAAAKWADKILHPPSRLDKLGVKDGLSVRLVGEFDAEFLAELKARHVELTDAASKSKCSLVLYTTETVSGLKRITKLVDGMTPDGALWVVYPKGVTAIREIDVLEGGRAVGLKDIKVASFSRTHTALKFVVPVAARGTAVSSRGKA